MASTGISGFLRYGTGATADTYAGRVVGGEIHNESNLVWRPSAGGKNAPGLGGPVNIGGSATIEIADITLLNYFTRTSYTTPALTALTLEGAILGDVTHGWTQTGCVINGLNVSVGVGEALTAALDWMAIDEADNAAPAAPTFAGTHWEWFWGECTLNGATYKLQRMNLTASNNCEAISSVENKTAGTVRLPEAFKVGKQTVSLSAEMLTRPSTSLWNMHEDSPLVTGTALIQVADGTHTMSFTLTALAGRAARLPFQADDGMMVFAVDMEAEPNLSTALAIGYS